MREGTLFKKNLIPINLRSLDALRGVLALYVLMGHCRWLLWAGHSEWIRHPHPLLSNMLAYSSASLRYGHEAVTIFFVLSGFFIHLRASKEFSENESCQINLISFFQRRCHRLVPPYFLALILTFFLDLLGRFFYPTLYIGQTTDTFLNQTFLQKDFSITSVVPALLLLPTSMGKDFGTNAPLWSLAYEVVYYLLYPLWLSLRRCGAGLAYGLGIGLATLMPFILGNNFFSGVFSYYPIWLVGAAIIEGLMYKRINRQILLLSCLLSTIVGSLIHIFLPHALKIFLYILLGSSVVLVVAKFPDSLCKNKLHRLFEWIGIQSYTIYICHFPIVVFLSAFSIQVLGGRPMHGWLALIGCLVTFMICYLCFIVCERQFLHSRLKV